MQTNNQILPTAPPHHPYRVSVFWPLILIGLGVVLLLSNMHYLPGNVWDWVWRLWPVILIAWGLDALIRLEFVGATVLIGLGGLFLAATFGYYSLNPLEIIFRLWPLFVVSAGLGLIFSRRHTGIVGSLIGAILMAGVLGLAIWQLSGQLLTVEATPGPRFTQALEGATKANVTIAPAAGSLRLKALPEPSALVDGVVRLPANEGVQRSFSVKDGVANLTLRDNGAFVGVGPLSSDWYRWDLGLNPNVLLTLRVDQGAGDAVIDLSGLKVSNLTENQAVGSTTVTLPQAGDMQARLSSAIGSTTLIVPPGAAVRLHVSGAIFTADIPAEYTRRGDVYTSPNYESAADQIDVYVNTAIGTLTVRTQTGR